MVSGRPSSCLCSGTTRIVLSARTGISSHTCSSRRSASRPPRHHLAHPRHSAASFLLAAGTHTKVVREHLGHSSCAITADIYSHVSPAQQREAVDRLDQALCW
ncbi:tyrosine-type recombinase/integrase [Geodermatophilus sp. WL48A]|uniref:Tyrosine-type recombinase/integrase n=1 Tax=Geodermatophilus maliterrae TaxID=3162531 RepID=A0ABV3XCX1_9ACTN